LSPEAVLAIIFLFGVALIGFGIKAIYQLSSAWEDKILNPETNEKKPKKRKKKNANR
jgi:hypothetical protein